jgi:multiple sugar transport system ATP-binding protein
VASVTLQQLTKRFGDFTAVAGLDLRITDGEFVTFLGPSGCGKSTALACIAGLEDLSDGSIVFDGRDVTELEPHERNVAMVFQDYALYPHMTARENMSFGLRQQKVEPAKIRRQVETAAEMLGLEELLERRPAELSGGQRQRVAVGRAVVRNPAVLLMDEPLSNLDASLRVRTRTEIKRLQRDLGITSVFVTHDQEEAMVLSDRVVVIRNGKLQQVGPPMEVYRRPANLFVAGFIGSPAMNLLEVELARADGHLQCRLGTAVIDLPLDVVEPASLVGLPGKALLGIRPTDLTVGPAQDGPVLRGEVFLVEPIGPVSYVDLDVEGRAVKAVADPDTAPAPGERIDVACPARRVHLFDASTEERL